MRVCDEKKFRKEFGTRLKKLIDESGMDKLDVSLRSGIAHNSLEKYIRGSVSPSIRSVINLRYALGCEYEDLIGFCDFIE